MFETVVLATDGSESAARAVTLAFDFAERFDATIHALYVVDETEVETSPERVRADLQAALQERGEEALSEIESQETDVTTAVRRGDPADEICAYAEKIDADLVVTGTRGRHGEHAFLLGSVAEAVVRRSPVPVLTARQLDPEEAGDVPEPGEMGA
ncbi:Nucleotide-binding protein, UspA family [Halapricum desulfuricans]|uniref:Nucleotide-binding protein, UspA family n=1 Tax=Halapricum desulfuricans TaxID=2841257 RepID=A0A897NJ25_9EURY|nr:universal stress protein [Halapricum desulfuricans]QSG12742.1 Nucleotide-binding protein, UspA family [Halapricum desulfuricans]